MESTDAASTAANQQSTWPAVSLSFPQARVKKIMKADKDLGTEVFLEFLTGQAAKLTATEKRKTVTYKDIASTVSSDPRLHFLTEIIPKPVPLAEAIEAQRRHHAEMGQIAGLTMEGAEIDESVEMDGSPELDVEYPPQGTTFE
ncbi:hypothetical protein PSACC_00864 [Paramicrosporidium saccamoebae]|uniref:Transcription factor CBF/NF-Y/archaeal histone domain-containing protein n=1 Tax=Paramicrosporidium saccamoebae TaxID=1246581 RepID=A0A2H9TNQ5_9FUNG|nr:hypothetical protein PSACC_00864 [Paramicrosporidium saccamoebae]